MTDVERDYMKEFGILPPKNNKEFYDKTKYAATSNAKSNFWTRLGWKEGGKEYWRTLKKICKDNNIELFILTAPPSSEDLDPTFRKGRKEWVLKNLGAEWLDKLIFERDKQKYANPQSLLIDDLEGNINRFKENGGKTIKYTDYDSFIDDFISLKIID
jgi:hypothetical protein